MIRLTRVEWRLLATENVPRLEKQKKLTRKTVLCTAGKHDSQACFIAKQSWIALTSREAELHGIGRRLPGMGSTALDQTMVGAGSPARVDGWITKSRDDIKANLSDLGTDRDGSRSEDNL